MADRTYIQTPRDLAVVIRGRRHELGLSQAELSQRAATSRKWVYEFEAGKPTAEIGLLLRVLGVLGLEMEVSAGTQPRDSVIGRVDLDRLLADLEND